MNIYIYYTNTLVLYHLVSVLTHRTYGEEGGTVVVDYVGIMIFR